MANEQVLAIANRSKGEQEVKGLPFFLTLLYLLFEFGRPQSTVRALEMFRLPAIITILLALLLFLSQKLAFPEKETKLFIFLLIFMVIHVPMARNNYWAFHTTRTMLITFVAYLSVITFIDSTEKVKFLFNFWLAVHAYLAATGIIGGGRGIGGFLGDENDLCLVLNMVLPFSFYAALSDTNKTRRLIYAGLTVFFIFAIITTQSRGGFLGLVAAGGYCWLRSPKKIFSAVALGLLILAAVQFAPDSYWKEVESIREEGTQEGTGAERVYQWKIGWAMFLDNPVIGVGQGNFPYQFRTYEEASGFHDGFRGRSRAGRAAHSLYFTLIPELGVVGVWIFLAMIYYCLKDLRSVFRSCKPMVEKKNLDAQKLFYLGRAMEASLIAFLVTGTFISVLYYPSFWLLMAFIIALKRVTEKTNENSSPSY